MANRIFFWRISYIKITEEKGSLILDFRGKGATTVPICKGIRLSGERAARAIK